MILFNAVLLILISLRYALHFYKETKAEIEARKLAARETLAKVLEEDLEIDFKNYFPPEMNFPRRPAWNFNMSREELSAKENRYFTVSFFLLILDNLKLL